MSTKRMTRREFLRAAGITSVGLVAAACAPSIAPTTAPSATSAPQAAASPRRGGTLRFGQGIQGTFGGYPPKISGTSDLMAYPAIEKLFRVDQNLQPIPHLATGISSDVNAKTITLTLRKGVKFHDGTDFNAAAVKWNLEQQMAGKVAAAAKLGSVDAVDDSTVRLNLSEWDISMTLNLCQVFGMIVSPTAAQKNGIDWAIANPVGTGPFQFVSWQKDANIKYKRFDNYWQKDKPYLDAVEIIFIGDENTRQLSLQRGEIDMVSPASGKMIPEMEKAGFAINRRLMGSGAGGIVPDAANPKSPWADLRVRQAANHAIDWDAVCKAAYAGEYEVANQWAYKGHWAYNADVKGYPYNVEKAKQLLAEAGFANGFKTKLTYTNGLGGHDLVAQAAQSYLKAVGIDASLEMVEMAKFVTFYTGNASWDGLYVSSRSGNVGFLGQLRQRYGGQGWNASMLVPDDYKKAIDSAVTAADFQTEQKYVLEAQKMLVDKYALILFGHNFMDSMICQKYVRDTGVYVTSDASQWTPETAWLDKPAA